MPVVVAAPDKFRGSATAVEVAGAVARAASRSGWSVIESPLSDGGEGLLEVVRRPGDQLETTEVTGPLGTPVRATWLLGSDRCVIEMARASGLTLAGGPDRNRPMEATTRGTGQLLVAAARALAATGNPSHSEEPPPTIIVGIGGSATTDGGLGALEAIEEAGGLGRVELIGACDVLVGFLDAARVFGPQKGATPPQVAELVERLDRLADQYQTRFGVEVRDVPGAGATGGVGGAVVALGGRLETGYRLVAGLVGLGRSLHQADLVITGEGALDATSFAGKVVGGVLGDASAIGVPALVFAGRATTEAIDLAQEYGAQVVSLSDRFGEARSLGDTVHCVEEAVTQALAAFNVA
ncbi:MAG TPA: glycerate kinase [Acidimicrobiales bacterium]|nr:glycerate kinase [Acidimicrobiales bacterium]